MPLPPLQLLDEAADVVVATLEADAVMDDKDAAATVAGATGEDNAMPLVNDVVIDDKLFIGSDIMEANLITFYFRLFIYLFICLMD